MAKWKPRPHRHLGRVVASVEEHHAETRRSVRENIGEDREIRATPAWQIPISAILTEIVTPHREGLEDPNSPDDLSALTNLATMAWNLSRLLRGTDERAKREAMAGWDKLPSVSPALAAIADVMLAQASVLHPDDTRFIVRADVVMKNGQPFIHAASTPGAAAQGAGAR